MKNDYFILTRFNLNLYPRDKRQMPTRTPLWLEHRFEVFERYCLPSVAAQTDKNFTWLCLFDTQTPDEYRSRIEGYSRVCPQFRAVWYDAAQAASLTESLRTTLLDCKLSESGPGNFPPPSARAADHHQPRQRRRSLGRRCRDASNRRRKLV